ncbi:MAG: methyltransferase [Clostridia bacterium]|nr:methyltransferase [Clostridia bacterium]
MAAKIEDLGVFGLKFIQPEGVEKFGTDSILLSDFAARKLRPAFRVADLCSGSGIIALLLAARHPAYVASVELDPEAAEAARENARLNHLPIDILSADIRSAPLPPSSFDMVTCNPPYFQASSKVSPDEKRRQARTDAECTFFDVAGSASRLLKYGGTFFAVYRPERLTDALTAMRQCDLEPKTLRFVAHTTEKAPFAVLLEGKKGAHPGMTVAPPLTMQSEAAHVIYRGRQFH